MNTFKPVEECWNFEPTYGLECRVGESSNEITLET